MKHDNVIYIIFTNFCSSTILQIGDGVRTLIKGKGHGYRKMNNPTFAIFRADKKNHLVSVAVALHPSPDWFLGVTRFELCQEDNTWLRERELNLFPWDAGTDSGVSYEVSYDLLNGNFGHRKKIIVNMHDKGEVSHRSIVNYH